MSRIDGVIDAAETNETRITKGKIVEIVKCVNGMDGTR